MAMPNVLITHPRLRGPGPHLDILRSGGFEVRLPPADCDLMKAAVLAEQVGDAQSVLAGTEPFTRAVIARATRLRVIARCGVGYDAIDVEAAEEHGIAVTITPGTNEHSVAEHALAMLLALSRGFPLRDRQVRRGEWRKVALPRLAGQTLGIVGLGRIGKALAGRVVGLDVRILVYEPYPDREFVKRHSIELTSLEDLLRRSDFVSLHLPLAAQTRGLINHKTLALMKPRAILVNTARGGLVVEQDLYEALRSGRLAAAGLDVFHDEPVPQDHPLLELDNVLVSPHVAGLDEQSDRDSQRMVARVLVDLAHGRWPADCIVNLRGVSNWKW
jgi:phosphoglycerate dehydrogenase-like enzyme